MPRAGKHTGAGHCAFPTNLPNRPAVASSCGRTSAHLMRFRMKAADLPGAACPVYTPPDARGGRDSRGRLARAPGLSDNSKRPAPASIPARGIALHAEGGGRTRTPVRAEDFKSHVSAIPPLPRYKGYYTTIRPEAQLKNYMSRVNAGLSFSLRPEHNIPGAAPS